MEAGNGASYLTPLVSPEYTEIDLKITYRSHLHLKIDNKTNKFHTNNLTELTKYLHDHDVFLRSQCTCYTTIEGCYTTIEGSSLEFNVGKGFVKPFGVAKEVLVINDGTNMYFLHTTFREQRSILEVTRLDRALPLTPCRLVLPATSLRKFKNREHFINKMKTYLTFS